jgi:hypothetical protein
MKYKIKYKKITTEATRFVIDGVKLVTKESILFINLESQFENGLYIVGGAYKKDKKGDNDNN